MGPAAGMGLGPQVPAGAPSSSPTWPRVSTVEGEPASAWRVRGWHDEAVDACGAEAKTLMLAPQPCVGGITSHAGVSPHIYITSYDVLC